MNEISFKNQASGLVHRYTVILENVALFGTFGAPLSSSFDVRLCAMSMLFTWHCFLQR